MSIETRLRSDYSLCQGEAIALAEAGPPRAHVALVLGACFGEACEGFLTFTEAVADAPGADGPRLTINTACSASTNAAGLGRDLLRAGTADVVLTGDADVLCPEVFAGFDGAGVLNAGKCAPFSPRRLYRPPGATRRPRWT